jgi:hypothetical protein
MTQSGLSQAFRILRVFLFLLLPLLGFSTDLTAQTHVVSPTELQKEAVAAGRTRQHDLETINRLFSLPKSQKILQGAGIDPAGVKTAVAVLSDQELARLAARSAQAQADFAAGRMSDRDLLLILIGLAALILIIVAVH